MNAPFSYLHIDLTNRDSFAKELQINIDGYAGEIPVFIEFQKVLIHFQYF